MQKNNYNFNSLFQIMQLGLIDVELKSVFSKVVVFFVIAQLFFLNSCKNEVQPKPKGMLSLEYNEPEYMKSVVDCGFSFEKNNYALIKKSLKKHKCGYVVEYPKLNASIYLSYREINNDLKKLLTDAQNLTQEHVVKADEIIPKEYINEKYRVYGMFYDVLGNAASQSQFYVTDSIKHFLLGSVYFNVKPNYDSLYPAAKYLQRDMRYLMETIRWEVD